MNLMTPFLALNCSCNMALQQVKHELSQAGLRVLQTFDLQSARHAPQECPCPHHGAEACDCQMAVLLVYGESNQPATLLLHGNRNQTWVSLIENAQWGIAPKLRKEIQDALENHLPILS